MWTKVALLFFVGMCAAVGVPGGWSDWSSEGEVLNDERVLIAARTAVKQIGQALNSPYHVKLVDIGKVRHQVVAGLNYEIELTIGKTKCRKSNVDFDDVDDCEFQEEGKVHSSCTAVVYRNLQNVYKVTSASCSS